jgi:hypothetical protein
MSKDESDHVLAGVYVGVGILLAAGAGYLAWKYLLDDTQRNHAKDLVRDSATKAQRTVRDAGVKAKEAARSAKAKLQD